MRGALQVIEKFRNDPLINQNRDINFWVPWILITIEGYDSFALHHTLHDYPFFYTKTDQPSNIQLSPQTQPKDNYPTQPNLSSIRLLESDPILLTQAAISEFLNFLRRVEHLSLVHTMSPTKPPSPGWLFAVLSLPIGAREGVRGPVIQTTCRLASLIYINAALWELRSSPALTSQFLRALKLQVQNYKLGWTFSIEKLLHIMIEAEMDLFTPRRSYFTARMINVAKRLDGRSWDRVNEFLMQCLWMRFQGSENAGGKSDSFLAWEEDLKQTLYSRDVQAHEYYPGEEQ
jgi:hypothetical protein